MADKTFVYTLKRFFSTHVAEALKYSAFCAAAGAITYVASTLVPYLDEKAPFLVGTLGLTGLISKIAKALEDRKKEILPPQ